MTKIMSKLRLLLPIGVVLSYFLSACHTDYMVYDEAKDRVYFSLNPELDKNTTVSTFQYWIQGDQLTVSRLAQVLGFPVDRDREIRVEIVDSLTTAIEGQDFVLPEKFIIPAGEVSVTLPVITWNRRQEGDTRPETLCVGLTIVENEAFIPALGYTLKLCYTHGAVNKPLFWSEARLGTFSVELLNKFLDQYNSLKETDPKVYDAIYQYTGEFWDSSLWSWPAAVDYLVMKYIVAPLYDYYQKNPNPVVAIPPVFLP